MRYLLDTHVVLWAIGRSSELSATARSIIADPINQIYASAVSFWEASLKYGLGKLKLVSLVPDEIPQHCRRLGFEIVPLGAAEAATYHLLPRVATHRDPFDRMLIHQCVHRNMTIISRDSRMKHYRPHGLRHVW